MQGDSCSCQEEMLPRMRSLPLLSPPSVVAFRRSFFAPQLPCRFPPSHFSPLIPAISTWFLPDGAVNRSFFETLGNPHRLVGVESITRDRRFERVDIPFSMFLEYLCMKEIPPALPRLYLAQVPLLPELQHSLEPVPEVVKQAGKGDVYATNLWIGRAEHINTPLHKDPNPNLFVQLAGRKRICFLAPDDGKDLFRSLGMEVGRYRDDDMMVGDAKEKIEEAVWNSERLEEDVGPGDAIFIPSGWWHAVKGLGEGISGSVNWWFR